MDSKVKKKWLRALRSGRYQQGRHRLRTKHNKFCCLGVLCDLHAKATGKKGWKEETRGMFGAGFSYLGQDTLPPQSVCEWAGFPKVGDLCITNPKVKSRNGRQSDLAKRNDNRATFAEIADLIEAQL